MNTIDLAGLNDAQVAQIFDLELLCGCEIDDARILAKQKRECAMRILYKTRLVAVYDGAFKLAQSKGASFAEASQAAMTELNAVEAAETAEAERVYDETMASAKVAAQERYWTAVAELRAKWAQE